MVQTRQQRAAADQDAAARVAAEFTPAFFDESSRAWLANKRKCVNCTYKYTCDHTYQSGKRCARTVYKTGAFCRQHWALAAAAEKKKAALPKQETVEWSVLS
jgi:hypothetical protein